jgi:hypothetical protein
LEIRGMARCQIDDSGPHDVRHACHNPSPRPAQTGRGDGLWKSGRLSFAEEWGYGPATIVTVNVAL